MTHPNFVTNGASLEDCHTNFFALADLSGIKWRRLSCDSILCVEPVDDPVLSSYCKCLSADIICVWRRVSRAGSGTSGGGPGPDGHPHQHSGPPGHHGGHPHHPGPHGRPMGPNGLGPMAGGHQETHHQLQYSKELWIFWYGEEPDLSGLVCSELTGDPDEPCGSWEHGLSYECRGLLFKALHNLIERCLLARGFTRLGKWFTEPKDKADNSTRSAQLTFSLNFFIHGESTICASVDVRHHPTVYRLNRQHILSSQGSNTGVKAILSPYGLAGTLTGQSFKDNDPTTQRLLNEWRQFYPVPVHEALGKDYASEENQLPYMVEVVVGGAKMRYPSNYIFVIETEEDSSTKSVAIQPGNSLAVGHSRAIGGVLTPPISPSEINGHCCVGGVNRPVHPNLQRYGPPNQTGPLRHPQTHLDSLQNGNTATKQCQWAPNEENVILHVKNNVWQDCTVSNQPLTPEASPEDAIGHWDFQDPSARSVCGCYRCKIKGRQGGQAGNTKNVTTGASNVSSSGSGNTVTTNSVGTTKKGEKGEKSHPRLKGMTPFHRRSPVLDSLAGIDSQSGARTPATTASDNRESANVTNPSSTSAPLTNGPSHGPNSASSTPFQFNKGGMGVLPSLRAPTPSSLPQLQTSMNSHGNMESPHPATPGLLMENSGSTAEPAMPTLSPHPPILAEEDVKVESQEPNPTQSPMSNADPMSNNPVYRDIGLS